MTATKQEERNPEGFGIIQLDYDLLGRVLTEYAHTIEHIADREYILVEDVEYDQQEKLLTTFISITEHTEH